MEDFRVHRMSTNAGEEKRPLLGTSNSYIFKNGLMKQPYIFKCLFLLGMSLVVCLASVGRTCAQNSVNVGKGIDLGTIVYSANTSFGIGDKYALFDGDISTLAVTPSVNPLVVTLNFVNGVHLSQAKIYCATDFAWTLETAQTLADLDAKSGSYHSLFTASSGSANGWVSQSFSSSSVKFVRLTIRRTVGDDYVHVNEIELVPSTFELNLCSGDGLMVPGGAKKMVAKGVDPNGNEVRLGHVTFESSDPTIALIDTTGWVTTSLTPGDVQIRATYGTQVVSTTLTSSATVKNKQAPTKIVKVGLLIEDFQEPTENNRYWHDIMGYFDPAMLAKQIEDSMEAACNFGIDFQVTKTIRTDRAHCFTQVDGASITYDNLYQRMRYDDIGTYTTLQDQKTKNPSLKLLSYDYAAMVSYYQLCEDFNSGLYSEVWFMGNPLDGLWEANAAGPTDSLVDLNGPNAMGTSCKGLLCLMGFNNAVDFGYAMHSFGHRVEGMMSTVYSQLGLTDTKADEFQRFESNEVTNPGQGNIGSVHIPVNGTTDYDYGNPRTVASQHANWLNYPYLGKSVEQVTCSKWHCSQSGYMTWWFNHLPRYEGVSTYGVLNDWLYYMAHFHEAKVKGLNSNLVCKGNSVVTDVAEKEEENGWVVYPNPSSGLFTLRSDKPIDRVSVIDVLGKTIWTKEEMGMAEEDFGSELSQGLYQLSVHFMDGTVRTGRLMKK
jgi:hypothetical protein